MEFSKIEDAMRQALLLAEKKNVFFAAVLLNQDGEIVMEAVNSSADDGPVAHAEMNLLAKAGKKWGKLPNHILVTTGEPCPMCMSAAIWSRIPSIYYGISITAMSQHIDQIDLSSYTLADHAFYKPTVYAGVLAEDCLKRFQAWYESINKQH